MIKATKTKNRGGVLKPRKKDVFDIFVDWIALPTTERAEMGIETQTDFAKKYGIHNVTLTTWKKREDFKKAKQEAQVSRLENCTADVLEGLKDRCVKYGMAYDVELFLLYVEKWDRKHVLEILGEIKLGDNDIRTIVDLLPENKQKAFYETITDLIAEAESTRDIVED